MKTRTIPPQTLAECMDELREGKTDLSVSVGDQEDAALEFAEVPTRDILSPAARARRDSWR